MALNHTTLAQNRLDCPHIFRKCNAFALGPQQYSIVCAQIVDLPPMNLTSFCVGCMLCNSPVFSGSAKGAGIAAVCVGISTLVGCLYKNKGKLCGC